MKAATAPGRMFDGHGLFLFVTPGGARCWKQRITVNGRRQELGLGPYPVVTLREAREAALANRRMVRAGLNPKVERRRAHGIPTFRRDGAVGGVPVGEAGGRGEHHDRAGGVVRPSEHLADESGGLAPSARRGAIWYLDWLDSDLPPGVQFPLGVNHWLREPVFPDDHWLFGSDDGPTFTWIDCHNTLKASREARLVEQHDNSARMGISVQQPARRHKPMPLCLIRCIHAAFERVTTEHIADYSSNNADRRVILPILILEFSRHPAFG